VTTGGRTALEVPSLRRWSRREMFLAGVLLTLAASAWTLTHLMGTPDMRVGILTGTQPMGDMPMGDMMPAGQMGAAFFLATWIVMMAAMMLPSLVPFTIGVARLMRAGGAGRSGTALLTVGYFAVWAATGAVAYLVWRGFAELSGGSAETAARAGAAVLFGAAIYQLTPLKRVCLRHCRSPSLLLLQHGPQAVASRFGATRAGLAHGLYCLGCCWALMAVLLALGVMSLVWMGVVAAVIAVEKVTRYGEHVSRGLGVLLAALAVLVLLDPAVLATIG
jgi:predicted metal-binding membrane protein